MSLTSRAHLGIPTTPGERHLLEIMRQYVTPMTVRSKAAKPACFVASSAESLGVAYAIQQNLEDDAWVTVWDQGPISPAKTVPEAFDKILRSSDFGVFVFAPADVLHLHRQKYAAVRDNVLFELGMFVGRLGRARSMVVAPKRRNDLRIPSDLHGVAFCEYDATRTDNVRAALGPACHTIRLNIKRLGKIVRSHGLSAPVARSTAAIPADPFNLLIAQLHQNTEILDELKQVSSTLTGLQMYLNECFARLWRDSWERAENDIEHVPMKDPVSARRHGAEERSRAAAHQVGLLEEWEQWFKARAESASDIEQ